MTERRTLASSGLGIGIPGLIHGAYAARSRWSPWSPSSAGLRLSVTSLRWHHASHTLGSKELLSSARWRGWSGSVLPWAVAASVHRRESDVKIANLSASRHRQGSAFRRSRSVRRQRSEPDAPRIQPEVDMFPPGHGQQGQSAVPVVVDRCDDRLAARELEGSGRQLGERLLVALTCRFQVQVSDNLAMANQVDQQWSITGT